jgi:hypothetical protein
MFRRRFVKEIKGRVFLDTNNDGIMNNSEQPLKDIGIRLFVAGDDEISGTEGTEILIRREKLILNTKTDEAGEFRFLVREGAYSVCLDVDTLPSGKVATKTDKSCEAVKSEKIDFPVRDNDPEAKCNSPVQADIGRHFNINTAKVSSADRVRLARRLGVIDEHTEIEYLLHALYGRQKLPEDYRSRIPIKSGTGFLDDIRRYMQRSDADPKIVEAARQALASSVPKLDEAYKSPSGYFNIHYALSGENSVEPRGGDRKSVV